MEHSFLRVCVLSRNRPAGCYPTRYLTQNVRKSRGQQITKKNVETRAKEDSYEKVI